MKKYIKPVATIVRLTVGTAILAGSDIYNKKGDGTALGKDDLDIDWDDWDEDEEESDD